MTKQEAVNAMCKIARKVLKYGFEEIPYYAVSQIGLGGVASHNLTTIGAKTDESYVARYNNLLREMNDTYVMTFNYCGYERTVMFTPCSGEGCSKNTRVARFDMDGTWMTVIVKIEEGKYSHLCIFCNVVNSWDEEYTKQNTRVIEYKKISL